MIDDDDFVAEWQAWHARHEARRADRHGFLAITSINWLNARPQRFEDAPGEWSADASGIHVSLAEGEELVIDGQTVCGRHSFVGIPEGEGVMAEWGDVRIEVAVRGGHGIVRPRHPDWPVLAGYRGTPAYPPQQRWAITGRFVPSDHPGTRTVGSVVDGLELEFTSPGSVEFEVDGRPLSLTVYSDSHGPNLTTYFTDATSGVTTYGACRALSIGAPAADGTVRIDFNRATNLPCAYTAMATCPIPPPENRLPIAVEAGEQLPR